VPMKATHDVTEGERERDINAMMTRSNFRLLL